MTDERLPASVEASSLVRRVEAEGGFATILNKGDADRGALILVISSRGAHVAVLERVLDFDRGYRWQKVGPSESANPEEVAGFLAKRRRFDADSWLIELDIAEPERFIAETTGEG